MSLFVYPAIIHKDGDTYGVVFPDFPGCVTVGDSQKEIALNAPEALGGHVEVMMDEGLRLPEPTSIESLTLDAASGDIAIILVTAYAARSETAA